MIQTISQFNFRVFETRLIRMIDQIISELCFKSKLFFAIIIIATTHCSRNIFSLNIVFIVYHTDFYPIEKDKNQEIGKHFLKLII